MLRSGLGIGCGPSSRGRLAAVPPVGTTAWFDASDLTTMFQNVAGTTPAVIGSPVGLWKDKSGNGYDIAAAANDTTRPTLRRQGGKYYVEFANPQRLYRATSPTMAQDGAMFLAGSYNLLANQATFVDGDGTNTERQLFFTGASTTFKYSLNAGSSLIFGNADTSRHIFTAIWNSTTSSLRIDGVPQAVSTGTTVGTQSRVGISMGATNTNTGPLSGRVYGMSLYSSTPSDPLIAANELYYRSLLPISTIVAPVRFDGAPALKFTSSGAATVGSVLAKDWNEPWSVMAAVKLIGHPSYATLIFTNVRATPYPGYEIYVDFDGFPHVRILHSYVASQYLGVVGTVDVCDGKWHIIGASVDGSGNASGVKIYVDGVQQTTTVEIDALGGLSSIGGTQTLIVGNQFDHLTAGDFTMMDSLGFFALSNIARDATYFATYATTRPPVDGNTYLAYSLSEGTGTTLTDLSGGGNNATLTAALWV